MIFEINLLKDRVKYSRKKILLRIIIYIELFLFSLTYLVLFSYRVTLNFKLKDMERNLLVLNEDIIFLSEEGPTLAKINEISKQYAELTSKLNTMNKLSENRVLFSHKLKGISNVLPENMWLDKFYVEEITGKKKDVKIKTICLSGFVMAEGEEAFKTVQFFIGNLEQDPLFKDGVDIIQLSSISKPRVKPAEGQVTEFEIKCNLTAR